MVEVDQHQGGHETDSALSGGAAGRCWRRIVWLLVAQLFTHSFSLKGGKKALLFGSNALVYQLASWKSDSDMISRKHVILRVCMLLAVQTPFSINLLHCCLF